jgi:hypothetical protein
MTETKLLPDAGTICALLGIEAGPLADIFRREIARHLRLTAERVEDGIDTSRHPIGGDVEHLLVIVEALEDEWSANRGDDDEYVERELRQVVARLGDDDADGTEATPRTPGETPPQSRDDILPGSGGDS